MTGDELLILWASLMLMVYGLVLSFFLFLAWILLCSGETLRDVSLWASGLFDNSAGVD